ncbi:MAG: helix-turn-helix domain-containing protein [Catenibacterium sp.]|uniref:helix-turn-helix domain-containing protein n=1 Tax=Catenibacterium sp. TaxID=2049022 RepID=UPI001EBA1ED3|nr:helix-turn-helix domain-containing protein [Catenibacterium sp.]MBS5593115.1 helix-turn-helix domain-containing protein [Catenibacterium sp.]
MKESRKQKDIFVKIPDSFREQGLTLEQAYIKGRVSRFNHGGLLYYESNKTLSKIMGKSESTVRRAIDGLVKEGYLYKKTLPRKRLLSTKPFNSEVQNEPNKNNNGVHREQLLDGHNEQLIDVHREHHESNKNASKSSMVFTENITGVHREHHEPFTENTYKDNRIDKLIEENPNPKNRSSNLNDLTPEEKEEYLQDLLDNMGSYDEDFY